MSPFSSPASKACCLLLLSVLLPSTSAIYEDQVGVFDWYKQSIGQPNSIAFVPGRERFYAATDQNLLASVQTKAGSIAWRRKYTDQDPLEAFVALQKPAVVVAASTGGKHLRTWDALSGAFKWEALVFNGQSTAGPASSCALTVVDLRSSDKGSAVAIAASDRLQVFTAAKGDLLWSTDLELAGQATHKHLVAHDDSITLVAYTPGTSDIHILRVTAVDGTPQHTQQLAADAPLSSTAAVTANAVAIISSNNQQICTLLLSAGADADVDATSVVCQDLGDVSADLARSVSNGGTGGVVQYRLLPAGDDQFSLTVGTGVAIIQVTGTGAQQSHWFPNASAAAAAAAGTPVTALASAKDSSVSVQFLDTKSGEILRRSTVNQPASPYPASGVTPHVTAIWFDHHKCIKSGSSSSSIGSKCQILVSWSDGQLSFLANNTVTWSREEALAAAQTSLVIDLPAAAAAAAVQPGSSSRGGMLGLLQDREKLKRWVRLQVLSVLVQFKLTHEHEKDEFYELRQELSDNNLPYRDTNGFRKLIILLTATGKVFGLHSGDGRILWTHNTATAAVTTASGSSSTLPQQQYLSVWKQFHDLKHAPQLAVITSRPQSSSVTVLNGHTGGQLQQLELPYGIHKVIPVHQPVHDGAADQYITLLVEAPANLQSSDSSIKDASSNTSGLPPVPRVHLLPNSPAAANLINKISSSLFFWLQSADLGVDQAATAGQVQTKQHSSDDDDDDDDSVAVFRGYSIEPGAPSIASSTDGDQTVGGGGDDVLPVVPAWQVVLPGRVLGVAAKNPAEPVHSYVKVLGDRSLKYRYLNPNLVFVATGTPLGSRVSPASATVSVALINTVTGAVIYQQVHTGCAGPVYAVVSENWVVYTMRDIVNMRQQASAIELYDASPHDLSLESIILGRTQHSSSQSSYGSVKLEVLTQSFYLHHFIKGLSVTQTKQGITTKQLLVRTITDQLYALDKRFLDPRRPMRAKATPEELEERLVPYNELVLFNTLQYVTQDKQVVNLRGVTVAGAVLESTTLVYCYGTDMFYTRMSPAQNFDSLQSDFSYGLLVVALVALLVGTWFASYSSQQAMLKAKWQ